MTPEQRTQFANTLRERLGNDPSKLMSMFAGGPQVEEAESEVKRHSSPAIELMKRLGMVAEVLVDGGTAEAAAEVALAERSLERSELEVRKAGADAVQTHRHVCTYATMLGLTNSESMPPAEVYAWLHKRCKALRAAGDSCPKEDRRESPVDVLLGTPEKLNKLRESGDAAVMGNVLAHINEIVNRFGGNSVLQRVQSLSDALEESQRQVKQERKHIEGMREANSTLSAAMSRVGYAIGMDGKPQDVVADTVESIVSQLSGILGMENASMGDLLVQVAHLKRMQPTAQGQG